MPDNGEPPDGLVDTSVALAVAIEDHPHHRAALEATSGRRLGLCGHACFETYSVLTRMPAPLRRTPGSVLTLLRRDFPHTRFLSPAGAGRLLGRLPALGLVEALPTTRWWRRARASTAYRSSAATVAP